MELNVLKEEVGLLCKGLRVASMVMVLWSWHSLRLLKLQGKKWKQTSYALHNSPGWVNRGRITQIVWYPLLLVLVHESGYLRHEIHASISSKQILCAYQGLPWDARIFKTAFYYGKKSLKKNKGSCMSGSLKLLREWKVFISINSDNWPTFKWAIIAGCNSSVLDDTCFNDTIKHSKGVSLSYCVDWLAKGEHSQNFTIPGLDSFFLHLRLIHCYREN